jgi:hypothetical protein
MARGLHSSSLCLILASISLVACGGTGGVSGQILSPKPSFTLSAGPSSATLGQGGSITITITVVGRNAFAGTVILSASGLPSGVTASFNPPSTTTTSILTLVADGTAAMGTTAVNITGTSGSLSPTTSIALTVAAPTLSISLTPKQAAIVSTTGTVQFVPAVTGNMGDNSLAWSVDGLPGGSSSVGTVNQSGLYTAPSAGGTHKVSATSIALPASTASANVAVTDLIGVFHYHNDISQDGINIQEYALTPAAVNTSTFGKLASCPVDGAVYAQPLWVPRMSIAGGSHNVLIVATQHDSVYAFDADDNSCAINWHVKLLDTLHGGTPN